MTKCGSVPAYKAAAVASPADEDEEPLPRPPAKKKQLFSQEKAATKQVPLEANGSGASGTIVIRGMVSDALYAAQAAYKADAEASPADEDEEPLPRPPAKKKQLFSQEKAVTKQVSLEASGSGLASASGQLASQIGKRARRLPQGKL